MHASGSFIAMCFMGRVAKREALGAFIGTSTIG